MLKKINIASILGSLLTLGATASVSLDYLIFKRQDQLQETMEVEVSGEVQYAGFNTSIKLNPGQSEQSTIKLQCSLESSYDIILRFNENVYSPLKEYVNVKITSEEDSFTYTSSLVELIDQKIKVGFSTYLYYERVKEIKIDYSMCETIGNEAQKKSADFKVEIEIKKKG